MPVSWRLIDTGPLDGPTNMAVDEALLLSFLPETSAPVLRLYGWSPPALSLGRFQKADEVLDLARCATARVPVVRRITGGGVIYHADELTYSLVCAPRHLPAATTIKESFRTLTTFLRRFYQGLNLVPVWAVDAVSPGERLGERTAYCFAGRESYDILLAGRKIGGNAQRRLKGIIFQHGSIPLANRAAEGAAFLRQPPAGVAAGTTSLEECGIALPADELSRRLAAAFAAALGVALTPDRLTPCEEENAAHALARQHTAMSHP